MREIFDGVEFGKKEEKLVFRNSIGAIYNLRKELARQFWLARKGKIEILVALENTRDLVAICQKNIIDVADRLQHKVMNQITKKYAKTQLNKKGVSTDDIKVSAVNTRIYCPSIKLKNMIG